MSLHAKGMTMAQLAETLGIKPQSADDKVDEIRQELDEIKEIPRRMQAN